jgi:hypothetical protein
MGGYPLSRTILQVGGCLGAVQAEFIGHHAERVSDGSPGVALVLGDSGDPVSQGAASQVRLRQDASDGDLPDHLVVGENHARPDRADLVCGQQLVDPLRLAFGGEELGWRSWFPPSKGFSVPRPMHGDRGGVGELDQADPGAAVHALFLVTVV